MKNKKKKIRNIIISMLCISFALYIIVPFLYTPNEVSYNTEKLYKDKKLIALTFDDGPSDYTTQLLDTLDEYDAKASFFVLGKKVEKYQNVIKRMYDSGHLVGNHTYNHKSLFEVSQQEFINELNMTDEALKNVTGSGTEFFRPPHGYYLGTMLDGIEKYAILWSYDTVDWKHQDADYVYEHIMKNAEDGAIILMHDTKRTTVDGVSRAIKDLHEQGYEFVRADEILCRNGNGIRYGLGYRACRGNGLQLYF